jgi:hypothetical protein
MQRDIVHVPGSLPHMWVKQIELKINYPAYRRDDWRRFFTAIFAQAFSGTELRSMGNGQYVWPELCFRKTLEDQVCVIESFICCQSLLSSWTFSTLELTTHAGTSLGFTKLLGRHGASAADTAPSSDTTCYPQATDGRLRLQPRQLLVAVDAAIIDERHAPFGVLARLFRRSTSLPDLS